MAQISLTFTVPDELQQKIIDDLAHARGYQDEVLRDPATSSDVIANPVDKLTFLKDSIGSQLIEQVMAYQAEQAASAASAAAKVQSAAAASAVSISLSTA